MYPSLHKILSSVVLVALLSLHPCACKSKDSSKASSTNSSDINGQWMAASATWYGAAKGAGAADNGGACGYKDVNLPPFNSLVSCGNKNLFKGGKGCGACYLIKCTSHPACSGKTSTIHLTDECNGGVCLDAPYHFDMAGMAFRSMATPGREDELQHGGARPIMFKRVPCNYPGLNIAFKVEKGSNPFYLAILIEYENGEGDLTSVELKEGGAGAAWVPMKESWGAIWRMDADHALQGPFSLRLTTGLSKKTLVADKVIPATWKADTTYRSVVNFSPSI